jgi:hypothetical protein
MSDNSTNRLIGVYMDEAEAPGLLSGFFQSPPRNFHTTEKVEIDIIRDDADIAIVVTDLSAGGRRNENQRYVNKSFTPPIFDEEGPITAYDLIKRVPGMDPFQDPDYGANATNQAFMIFRKLERKIRRSIELMAAQVLQTGALTLFDSSGTALYTLDFGAKSTHKATVGTVWATDGTGAGVNPLNDIEALALVVRRDGKSNPNRLIFGRSAWQRFTSYQVVKDRILGNFNSPQLGQLAPQVRGTGATFQGFLWIGMYRFEMWTYDGFYKHPQTGVPTPYVDDDHIIMMSDGAQLDLSYGAIPLLKRPDAGALSFLPPRMSSPEKGIDLTTNAWFTPDGKRLVVSAGTRPLTIPTAIDTFACLDVVP